MESFYYECEIATEQSGCNFTQTACLHNSFSDVQFVWKIGEAVFDLI